MQDLLNIWNKAKADLNPELKEEIHDKIKKEMEKLHGKVKFVLPSAKVAIIKHHLQKEYPDFHVEVMSLKSESEMSNLENCCFNCIESDYDDLLIAETSIILVNWEHI